MDLGSVSIKNKTNSGRGMAIYITSTSSARTCKLQIEDNSLHWRSLTDITLNKQSEIISHELNLNRMSPWRMQEEEGTSHPLLVFLTLLT